MTYSSYNKGHGYVPVETHEIFKDLVLSVSCPTCGSETGVPCQGVLRLNGSRRLRQTPHPQRYAQVGEGALRERLKEKK